ncbi:MAG: rhomboid family intramembrane serine protease [Planctomycetota bacterium]|nr:rhomboid family intramembrane serine protease [Planctomycetota bacterium]
MGLHDRDYMQAGARPEPLYRPGRLTWIIIAINGLIWLIYSSALSSARVGGGVRMNSKFGWMFENLALWPEAVLGEGKVWQLFTAFWMHEPGSAQHVLFNMLALFFFGRAVETWLGPRRYLAMYMGAGLFASIVYVLWSFGVGNTIPALGASGAVYAVLAWMALRQPRSTVYLMMVIPLPMWLAVGVFIIGMQLLQVGGAFTTAGSAIAHLAGAAFGAAFFFLAPRFTPSATRVERPRVPDGLEEAHRLTAIRIAMDRLLDKVHAEGIDALTAEEKQFLERAANELRNR